MSFLGDMVDYLTTAAAATGGTDLFAAEMPGTPDLCLCLYEAPGMTPVKAMGNTAGAAVLERLGLQVVARGARQEYLDARALAQAAFLKLDGMPKRSLNGVEYLWGSARQSPFPMGKDEDGRPLIAFNCDIHRRMSTST